MKHHKLYGQGLTAHALCRFIERKFQFDWTELKLNYMIEMGLPSIKYIEESSFLTWVEKTTSLSSFRVELFRELETNPERFVQASDGVIITYVVK